jgi:glyceraldehyde-3-phosphate dehydrogenase/erythrose-4-phosphate dehydrogenase
MEFNLIASEVLESAISFMRHENALSTLFQKSKKSVWLQKLHIQNQNKDAVLQVICDTAYGYIKKAIDTVSHLVSCLGMFC